MPETPSLTVRIPNRVRAQLAQRARAARLPLGAYTRLVLWDHVEAGPGLKLGAGFKTTTREDAP
jgi:hypothetical protein